MTFRGMQWLRGWIVGAGLVVGALSAMGAGAERKLPAQLPSPYRATDYRVEFDGASLPVTTLWPNRVGDPYTKLTVHYAAIESVAAGRLIVNAGVPVESFTVAPRDAIRTASVEGQSVAIDVAAPAKFMVRVNHGEPLFVWITAPAPDAPRAGAPDVVDVGQLGLDRRGTTDVTAALQRAIDSAAERGDGATVLVPAGVYRTGSLWMRSGVTLWLSAGAVLAAADDDAAFPRIIYQPRPGEHPGTNPRAEAALLRFENVRNASLRGPGTINAGGHERRARRPGSARLRMNHVRVADSEDIRLDGPVLRDAVFWSVHLLRSRRVVVRDLKIVNEMPLAGWDPRDAESVWNNTDGINPDACADVLIEDVLVHAGDDAIVFKATNSGPDQPPDLENVICRGLVLASSTTGVKFGTESIARTMRDIVVEDAEFLPIHRGRGVAFAMRDRALVENVTLRRLRFHAPLRWFDLEGGTRSPEQRERSRVESVVCEDIDLPAGATAVVRPPYPLEELRDIRFRNIRLSGRPVVAPVQLGIENFERIPALRVEPAGEAQETRPRLLVITDIGGDPDDQQSLIRLLVHANEFEIEGLIASASGIPGQLREHVTQAPMVHRLIDAYAAAQPNLARHAAGFPSPEQLRKGVRSGNPQRGRAAIGAGHDTEASAWIVHCLDRVDERPLNIALWGGQTDLAQALWRLREERGEATARALRARLRIYDVDDQDGLAEWFRKNFPDLFYVLARAPAGQDRREAVFRGMYWGGDETLTSRAWIYAHVRAAGAPLGELYPAQTWTAPNPHGALKEGDTPAWFFFLPLGPGDPAHPEWGGWGGRFARETDGRWRDAQDAVEGIASARATVWRWRSAYQNEFAARMRWAATPDQAAANHPPQPAIAGDDRQGAAWVRVVRAGDRVNLDATGSCDPDRDELRPRWWHYREAGSWHGSVEIEAADTLTPTVHVPADAEGTTIHVILELQDNGAPAMTRYRRVVLDVQPRK